MLGIWYAGLVTDDDEPYEKAVERLTESNGVVGTGRHGICFNGEQGEVIKLHQSKDSAYIDFINWVQTLTDESFIKHFPRILYTRLHGDHLTVICERLVHHEDLTVLERDSLSPAICPQSDLTLGQAMDQAKKRLEYAMNEKRGTQYMFDKSWARFEVINTLEEAMQALLLHVFIQGYACDLHDGNIMFRRNADLTVDAVIIDPFTTCLL